MKVTITEILTRTIEVEADNTVGALNKADEMINSEEVVLDESDFVDRMIFIAREDGKND